MGARRLRWTLSALGWTQALLAAEALAGPVRWQPVVDGAYNDPEGEKDDVLLLQTSARWNGVPARAPPIFGRHRGHRGHRASRTHRAGAGRNEKWPSLVAPGQRCDTQFEMCWSQADSEWLDTEACRASKHMCRVPLCLGRQKGFCGGSEEACAHLGAMCQGFGQLPKGVAPLRLSVSLEEAGAGNNGSLEFIHIPKNAGSTVEELGLNHSILWGRNNQNLNFVISDVDNGDHCNAYHMTPTELPPFMPAGTVSPYENSSTFCIVRHPYERAVSEYVYLLHQTWGNNTATSFGDPISDAAHPACSASGLNRFLQQALVAVHGGRRHLADCHFVPQSDYIWGDASHNDTNTTCNNVFYLDNLTSELNGFFRTLGFALQLPNHTLDTDDNSFSAQCPDLSVANLTNRTVQMLNTIYAVDLDSFTFERTVLDQPLAEADLWQVESV